MTEITNSEEKPKGRKKKSPEELMDKMYVFVLPAVRAKIETLAKQTDRSPSAMIRVLVMKGLEQMGEV